MRGAEWVAMNFVGGFKFVVGGDGWFVFGDFFCCCLVGFYFGGTYL